MGVVLVNEPEIGTIWRASDRRDGFGVPSFRRAMRPRSPRTDSRATGRRRCRPASQMLLEADTLIYDNDNETVTAVGGVQIDYGGNRLVAERVTYNRKTGRLVASGNVEIVDSNGTKINSDEIDITDDFADGFVNALRVETVDKTYFAAESAERSGGMLTTFNNGVYTACEPCEDKPDRAPIWRIKAQKIIWNGKAKTVRFENSRFEFFGVPIAYLPAFEIADPTVKRKSGFLIPGIGYKSDLGVGVDVPYYLALSPTYDLTLTGTRLHQAGLPRRGRMAPALQQWRVHAARSPASTSRIPRNSTLGHRRSRTAGDPNKLRGMVGTKGVFDINPRWTFGWDVLAPDRQEFLEYLQHRRLRRLPCTSRSLSDRAQRPQLFRPARHAFQGPGRHVSTSARRARNDKQPWVLPTLRLFLYARRAGGRRRARRRRQCARARSATSSMRLRII